MGYGTTTTLFYGHSLDWEQSKKLVECMKDFITLNPTHPVSNACDTVGISPSDIGFDWFEFFDHLSQSAGVKIDMVAQDSDSRIHDTQFERGFNHAIGVLAASSGYGGEQSSKELSQIMNVGATSEHTKAYSAILEDWIKFAGVLDSPAMTMASNTD